MYVCVCANVVIGGRNIDRLTAEAASLNRQFGADRCVPVACNIRKENDVQSIVSRTLSTFGKIDYLINNGGGQFAAPNAAMSLKGWNAVIETNLTGTWLMCREVYKQHMSTAGGCIVNIIAEMSRGFPMMSHTGAARAGVDNLTKSLAIEWAQDGVRINAIAPGIIYSDTAAANYGDSPEILTGAAPRIPAKRLGTVEEVSGLVCFLLSPAASFITGESVWIDGGQALYSPPQFKIEEHNKLKPYTWADDKPKAKL